MVTTAFRPSSHGWPFDNEWTQYGVCGGMCWSALDKFYRGEFISNSVNNPTPESFLWNEIYSRQMDSCSPAVIAKLYEWHVYRPDTGQDLNPYHSIGHLVQTEEWPRTRAEIDANRPVPLMLVRKGGLPFDIYENHQVLAYRYKVLAGENNKVRIWIYDPNYPYNNNIYIQITLGQSNSKLDAIQIIPCSHNPTEISSEDLRGFFVNHYDNPGNIVNLNKKLPDSWLGGIEHEKIIYTLVNERLHQYNISFTWTNGNVPVDFTILRFLNSAGSWAPGIIPGNNGYYGSVRCTEFQGSRSVPVQFNETHSLTPKIRVYLMDRLLADETITLPMPYLFALPYVHDKPVFINEPETEPEWSIKDLKMTDIAVMKEKAGDQEVSDLNERILDVRGEPVFRNAGLNDPNLMISGFQIDFKLGYITSRLFCKIYKGYLSEDHTITYKKIKRPVGAPTVQPFESGVIPLQQHDNFEIIQGFASADYYQDQLIEFIINAAEEGEIKATDKNTFYAKSLLRVTSPVYSSLIWDFAKFKDIHLHIHEYIDKSLLKDIVSEMPVNIQKLVNKKFNPIKSKFDAQVYKLLENVQTDPNILFTINSIYHKEFNVALHSKIQIRETIKTKKEIEKYNNSINNRAISNATEFVKACLIKDIIDRKVLNKVLSADGINY